MCDRQKCKVTVLSFSFTHGGVQKVMTILANALAKLGFDVTLLVMIDEGPYRDMVSRSVKIKSCNAPSARYRYAFTRLYRYFKEERPDVFISSAFNDAALLARMFARNRCRFISTIHGSILTEINVGWRSLRKRSVLWLSKILKNKNDAIVTISKDMAKEMISLGMPEEKMHVIYNPVITDDTPSKAAETIDHPWFVEKSSPIIFTAGHLSMQKDHETLIRAFAAARRSVDARLAIAGDGDLRDHLLSLADDLGVREYVDLLGYVGNPFPYMSAADLFVLSSRTEGLPTVIIESMFCGTPIVSTDCPTGPRELLDGGRYGDLVPVGDVRALADAIVKNLSDPTASGDILRDRAMAYTDRSAAEQYASLIDELISDGNGD